MQPWRIVDLDRVGSTNDEARRVAEAGDPGRLAIVAREQDAGRGRAGRAWASPPGGLYLTALLRPRLAPTQAGLLSLAAGVAVAGLIEGLGGKPELRWPNDVDLAGRKVAGVLCEARLRPDAAGFSWVLVGIGLNVATPVAELAAVGGTSLVAALGKALEPRALAEPLLRHLDAAVALAEEAPGALVEAWSQRAPMLGGNVEVVGAEGRWGGVARRVGPTGALVVRTPGGLREVHEGDVVRVRRGGAVGGAGPADFAAADERRPHEGD